MTEIYKKRPVSVEVVQWTGENIDEVMAFSSDASWRGSLPINKANGVLVIKTLEGEHIASWNDYIIKGVHGEFYPCKPDIFAKTYELVEE
jgi:hypothetical protein